MSGFFEPTTAYIMALAALIGAVALLLKRTVSTIREAVLLYTLLAHAQKK